jgi:hypothetical protein
LWSKLTAEFEKMQVQDGVHLSCSSGHLPPREEADRIDRLGRLMFLSTGDGMLDGLDPDDLTHANVMNGNVKYKTLN